MFAVCSYSLFVEFVPMLFACLFLLCVCFFVRCHACVAVYLLVLLFAVFVVVFVACLRVLLSSMIVFVCLFVLSDLLS